MVLIYWSVRLSSRRGGDGVIGLMGGILTLVRCEFRFIIEHENLV